MDPNHNGVFSLIGAVVGALLTWFLGLSYQRKTLYISTVTKIRADYTKEVRLLIAEFISLIQCYNESKDTDEILKKMVLIELHYNPLKDEWDEEYIQEMQELFELAIDTNHDEIELEIKIEDFKKSSQRIIGIEWDGIKLEAIVGKPNKHEKNKLRKKWK